MALTQFIVLKRKGNWAVKFNDQEQSFSAPLEAIKTLTLKISTVTVLKILIHIAEAGAAPPFAARVRGSPGGVLGTVTVVGS